NGYFTNVFFSINQPVGLWNTTNNVFIDYGVNDQSITVAFLRTNSIYALPYAFEPDWGWLQERQNQLEAYRQQGLSDTSLPVVSETLNVLGMSWVVQTAWAQNVLFTQMGLLPQFYHRFGRIAQETGGGYYIDFLMQIDGAVSNS